MTASSRFLKSPALWIFLGTVLAIAVLVTLRPEPPRTPVTERASPVQVREVIPQSVNPQLRLLGEVESPRISTLTASIGAEVAKVPVLEGAVVTPEQLLVALAPQEAELVLRQAEADLANLQAQISQEQTRAGFDRETLAQQETLVAAARRTVERERRLQESDLTSELRLDEARASLARAELNLINQRLVIANKEARLDALQAQLARAEALRDQARLDLARAEIRAPFAGVVTEVAVSPGERVRIGDPMLTLYSADALEVRAQLPHRWLPTVREAIRNGRGLTATGIANGERYPLILERLSGRVSPGAGGVDALFRFAGTDPEGRRPVLGRTLDIILELPSVRNAISLPVSALYGTNQVFKVVDGRLQSVLVELRGDRFSANGQQILVQSDELVAGDRVITTQLPNAVSGLKVEVRDAAPAGEAGS
jgi:RND family efflux transporter MFP subunit